MHADPACGPQHTVGAPNRAVPSHWETRSHPADCQATPKCRDSASNQLFSESIAHSVGGMALGG